MTTAKEITRRKYLKYVGGVAVAAAAAAAGYGIYEGTKPPLIPPGTTVTGTVAPTTAQMEKVKISFQWDMWLQELPKAWLSDQKQKFEQENPNIEVEIVGLNDWEVTDKLIHMIAAGTVYDASEIYVGMSDLATFVELGAVEPLDAFITKEERAKVFPVYLDAMTMVDPLETTTTTTGTTTGNKKLWALPGQITSQALYYNTRMFAEAGLTGPPDTMDDFAEACKAVTIKGKQWGYGLENWRVFYVVDDWLYARGGRYVNEDGKSAVNEQPMVDLMEWWKMLYDEGWVYPEFLKSYEWRTQFGLEKIAMWPDGNWMTGSTQINFPQFTTWDTAFLPRMKGGTIRGCLDVLSVAMMRQSKHKNETWKWLQRLWFNDDSAKGYAKAKWGLPWRSDWKEIGVELDPKDVTFIEQSGAGAYVPREVFPKPTFVSDTVALAFQKVVLGKESAQKALDEAAAEIDKVMALG